MHHAKILADELVLESELKHNHSISKIVLKSPQQGTGESFFSACEKGVLHIDAESPLAASYAISQLQIAAASGHLSEFLGYSQPRCVLRPIWVGSGPELISDDGLGVPLPHFVFAGHTCCTDRSVWKLFCRRIIELGYNSVILGQYQRGRGSQRLSDFSLVSDFCRFLQEFGLKVIIKPGMASKSKSRCPLDAEYRNAIFSSLQTLLSNVHATDFIFWESCLQHPDFTQHAAARDATFPELIAEDIRLLETFLPPKVSLIYFIPSSNLLAAKQHAAWMPSICDEAGKGTIISFPAVAGDCFADHLPPHPFWHELRQSPDVSSTPLLPLVNAGSVLQGEGLWPSPTLDLLEKYHGRLYRHKFAGIATLANLLPRQGSMLDCNLWTASQMLWRDRSPLQLAETWFHAFRPDWDFTEIMDDLSVVRKLVLDLSMLRSLTCESKRDAISSEDCRIITESVLTRLRVLKMRAQKVERKQRKRGEHPSFSDYLHVFARDAQRVVLHFLQCYNLSYPFSLTEEDLHDSFWMQVSPGAGQGIRSSAKVAFFDEPRSGAVGSRMEAIYNENRLI